MTLQVCRSLRELPEGFDEVFGEAAKSSFFLSLPWFMNLADHGLPGDVRMRCYACSEGGAAAALPMMHVEGRRRLESASNYYASLYMPVVAGDGDALEKIAAEISEERWHVVDLHPLDRDSPLFARLEKALERAGMTVLPYFCFGNWHLDVAGRSADDYFSGLPSRLRNTLKRKRKRLDAVPGAKIGIVTGGEGLEAAIADYQKVYQSSWKVPEPYPEFVPGLIRVCARHGWLRLGLLHCDGEPVAAQIWIVKDGIASIYKLAYDERFAALSAGSILTAELMRHVIDVDRVCEVDYLTGDDDYKRDWMSGRRERWGLVAYNRRTLKGRAMGWWFRGIRFARRVVCRIGRGNGLRRS